MKHILHLRGAVGPLRPDDCRLHLRVPRVRAAHHAHEPRGLREGVKPQRLADLWARVPVVEDLGMLPEESPQVGESDIGDGWRAVAPAAVARGDPALLDETVPEAMVKSGELFHVTNRQIGAVVAADSQPLAAQVDRVEGSAEL